MDNNLRPELTREINVSNLVVHMDGRIKEIISYLRMYKGEHPAIDLAIEKLEKI